MIILGIDPGTLITGYGIIKAMNGKISIINFGAIKNTTVTSMPLRLKKIFDTLNNAIETFSPDECAIETAFYGKNAQSALKLGHARGAAILAAVMHEIPTTEYSPSEVKRAVVGKGTASKEQVQYMVKSLLKMKQTPKFYDTTDALAVAICHYHRICPELSRPTDQNRKGFKDWKAFVTTHPEKVSRTTRY